jgi:hypothetical protein
MLAVSLTAKHLSAILQMASVPSRWHDGQVPEWVEFQRSDAAAVIDLVRAVADAADPGTHGDGVEVVIEAPRRGWLGRLRDDGIPEQARIAVTKFGGIVRYPFHVHLVTDEAGGATRRLPRLPGWAVSNSNGLAFLVQKGRSGDRYDWAGLVGGAVAALSVLRPDADDDGWRAGIDREVRRS